MDYLLVGNAETQLARMKALGSDQPTVLESSGGVVTY